MSEYVYFPSVYLKLHLQLRLPENQENQARSKST